MSNSDVKNVKIKKRPLRKRQIESDEDSGSEDNEEISSKVEEMKLLQKLRQRPNGVNIIGLSSGKSVKLEENDGGRDIFKVNSGGMVNMKALKSGQVNKVDDAYDTGIGTQFSAETNKRDEDEEMMKYIEEKLSKKKSGAVVKEEIGDETEQEEGGAQYRSPEEAALQAVPDHLRISSTLRSEEMLSNQMLSGIPEVDLGIDAKIRNIEATEEAKLRLLWQRHNAKEGPSHFVPTNVTVNFAHQNKIHVDDADTAAKAGPAVWKRPHHHTTEGKTGQPKRKDDKEKATDDYHYEKFKKQFRRY